MNIKKVTFSLLALAFCMFANAQKEIPDSATELLFDKQGALTRVIATEEEANMKIIDENPLVDDVPWRKVVLRVVDLREEQNKPLYYPESHIREETQKNLFAILFYNFLVGKLTGYEGDLQDRTIVPLFIKENEVHASDTDFMAGKSYFQLNADEEATPNPDDEYQDEPAQYVEPVYMTDPYEMINKVTQSCIQYYIQEAWYFDKHSSRMRSKILAIAPVFDARYNNDELGEDENRKPSSIWFWFPYNKVRPFLQQEYVRMSGRNTKQLINFDDFFTQRQFYSYILKDFDLQERKIQDAIYDHNEEMRPDDAEMVIRIQERQAKIEAEILDFEQDLWNY